MLPLVLPIAVLAIPALDLTMAYVRRTKAGRSPFAADKLHLHHRLMQRGHSHRRAVLLMYLWTALIAYGVVVLGLVLSWWTALDRAGRHGHRGPAHHRPAAAIPETARQGLTVSRQGPDHSAAWPTDRVCLYSGKGLVLLTVQTLC